MARSQHIPRSNKRGYHSAGANHFFPGMPNFLRREDVAARYAAGSGYEPRDLGFYETYAAVQWAIVFLRTGARRSHGDGPRCSRR